MTGGRTFRRVQEAWTHIRPSRSGATRRANDRREVRITDEGKGFDPSDVPDPTAIENLERPCGRGLMLMKHYMTEVEYNESGNSVSMAKVFRNNNGKK